MLDKFIGDALMAAFGLPVAHDDDEGPRRARRHRNDQRFKAMERDADRGQESACGDRHRLNTDTVVSGNIGSPRRMDYTVIGDGVNLASRLESACKLYSTRILMSENTYCKLRGTIARAKSTPWW